MVDFSHANSRKDYKRQMEVATDVASQMAAGDNHIFGVMVESHLVEGRQDLKPGCQPVYGKASPTPASAGPTPKPCSPPWPTASKPAAPSWASRKTPRQTNKPRPRPTRTHDGKTRALTSPADMAD